MNTYAITIGREFGSNGCEIGQLLAQQLNVPYYDREVIELSSKQSGLAVEEIENAETVMQKKEIYFLTKLGYGSSSSCLADQVIDAQAKVIRDLATKESCIIAGRCADYVLKEYKYLLNIFTFAPMQYKVKHIMESYGISEKSAERMIRNIDRQRHNYYKYVTGRNRGDRTGKHLLIDTSLLSTEDTVAVLYEIVIRKFPFAGRNPA